MAKSIEPADRRPLVYGVFVLIILIAATYLFWPRSPRPESLVLTPESVRTDSAAADLAGQPTPGELTESAPVEAETVDDHAEIAEETKISDDLPPPPVETKTSAPVNRNTSELTDNGPTGSGKWVINVGAFSQESSARARSEEISRQGMPAHVHRIDSDGKTLWRVRVGYFASKAKASEYTQWMKTTHGIEGWPSQR